MNKVYIESISSISPQPEDIFESGTIKQYSGNILSALDQDYKSLIKPMMLRRMSKAVKMGLFCAKKALADANMENPGAIIVGTGQGCLQDTEKFMESMLGNEDGLLSPTSFIQSTHNTVAGQIALDLRCTGYNMTFTQNAASFESALIDGLLQFQSGTHNILVGGVEETSKAFTSFQELDGQLKGSGSANIDLLKLSTPGTITSEAAAFFMLSSEKSSKAYAELLDVGIYNSIGISVLENRVKEFLDKNETQLSEIDLVILGINGDSRYDEYYKELQHNLFSGKCQLGYKHLVGDNDSISSYAFWLACKILKEKHIPEVFKLNTLNCTYPRKILIYNQYLGRNHGLILLNSL